MSKQSMHIKLNLHARKSRLAGFFLWRRYALQICLGLLLLLGGCDSQTKLAPGELAYTQAQQAQAQGLSMKADELFQHSAMLGYLPAVAARLARQQPTESSVELRLWLSSLPDAQQTNLTPYYQQLGSKLSPHQAMQNMAPSSAHCSLTIQPIVSTILELQQWQRLHDAWRHDEFLQSLPVCFLAVQRLDAAILKCSDTPTKRLRCDLPALQQLVKLGHFNQLLILSGRGAANFDNGVLQLPTYADIELLRHEFSHILGFIDEYALAPAVAKAECREGRITPNVLFEENDLDAYLAHWQLPKAMVQLAKVDTCANIALQAYRVVPDDSHLQHYELAVPSLYQTLMRRQLQRGNEIMPVQYYFAYLARQQADWTLWQAQMGRAADFGYPAAQAALAEWQQRQSANSTAR